MKDKILDSFDRSEAEKVSPEVEAHLADCSDCATFARKQATIDTCLIALLVPSEISDKFGVELFEKISLNRRRLFSDVLPDVLHFVTCAITTIICVFVLPIAASNVFAAGIITTSLTYMLMAMIRDSIQDAGRSDL